MVRRTWNELRLGVHKITMRNLVATQRACRRRIALTHPGRNAVVAKPARTPYTYDYVFWCVQTYAATGVMVLFLMCLLRLSIAYTRRISIEPLLPFFTVRVDSLSTV